VERVDRGEEEIVEGDGRQNRCRDTRREATYGGEGQDDQEKDESRGGGVEAGQPSGGRRHGDREDGKKNRFAARGTLHGSILAGRQGLEPRFTGPEPVVLPLNDLPVVRKEREIIADGASGVKPGVSKLFDKRSNGDLTP
jgi:hypothetical protein